MGRSKEAWQMFWWNFAVKGHTFFSNWCEYHSNWFYRRAINARNDSK